MREKRREESEEIQISKGFPRERDYGSEALVKSYQISLRRGGAESGSSQSTGREEDHGGCDAVTLRDSSSPTPTNPVS